VPDTLSCCSGHPCTIKHTLLGWFDLKHETLQLGTTSCVSSLSLPDITQMAKSPSPSPSIFAYTRLEWWRPWSKDRVSLQLALMGYNHNDRIVLPSCLVHDNCVGFYSNGLTFCEQVGAVLKLSALSFLILASIHPLLSVSCYDANWSHTREIVTIDCPSSLIPKFLLR